MDHSFPPTLIQASNFNTETADLRLAENIINRIGETRFLVENGDLISLQGVATDVVTNKFNAQVGGDITGINSTLRVRLIKGKPFDGQAFSPTEFTAIADGNIDLLLHLVVRDDTPTSHQRDRQY